MKKVVVFALLLLSAVYSISATSIDILGVGFGLREYASAFGINPPEAGSVVV